MLKRTLQEIAMRVLRPFCGGLGSIVVLHRVIPDADRSLLPSNRALEITPEELRAMLAWIRGGGIEVIPLDQVSARLAAPRSSRFLCFTFDDGYRDNLLHALPVFREFEMPFSVHVTNGFADAAASVWWYFVEEALGAESALRFSWQGEVHEFAGQSPDERNRALDKIGGLIRGLGGPRDELLARIGEAAGIDPCAVTRRLCMNWEEVRRLAEDPLVTMGAHTCAHHSLNRLSEAELVAEVEGGRRELAEKLGREVRHFAYPFGGANAVGEREFSIVRRSGFATMLTTQAANLTPAHARRIDRLPRWTVSGNYPALLMLRRIESGLAGLLEKRGR